MNICRALRDCGCREAQVCVEVRAFVGLPKAPHMTQMKNYMVATNCDCGLVVSFPNDGSNSIDAKWVTFERDCFKTNELLWKEGFICPDADLETIPARPLTGQGSRRLAVAASDSTVSHSPCLNKAVE